MSKISGVEPEKLLIEGDPHPYNNPDMGIVELAFIPQARPFCF